MPFYIGIDIGGTKVAGALFNEKSELVTEVIEPTPKDYDSFLKVTVSIVERLDECAGEKAHLGVGVPGAVDHKAGSVPFASNTPSLMGKPFKKDLEIRLKRPVTLENDADCAALSEALDGAGQGYASVFGLIMGTGVGGGFILGKTIIKGANGMIGEFGQLPLPFRETSDGPLTTCACGQIGCIDKTISGGGLERLYQAMTDEALSSTEIADKAHQKNPNALRVLDQFYTTVAKAMVTIIHTFDPEIIVVSGGLSQLPGLYEAVQARMGNFTVCKNPQTLFLPAKHGSMSGLRGAAWAAKYA